MTSRPLVGYGAAMSSEDALDIVLRSPGARRSPRVFITRRDGGNALEHMKALVASAGFEPVVARESTAGGRQLCDLIEQMRGCDTAIVHVTAGAVPADANWQPRIGDDVLFEIGAAMALYGREFVLLVEDAVALPPYLRGLRECRYSGDLSNMPATMWLLRTCTNSPQRPSEGRSLASGAGSAFAHAQQADAAARH